MDFSNIKAELFNIARPILYVDYFQFAINALSMTEQAAQQWALEAVKDDIQTHEENIRAMARKDHVTHVLKIHQIVETNIAARRQLENMSKDFEQLKF